MPGNSSDFVRLKPLGVSDSFYSYPEGNPTDMAVLSNLVPSLSNAAQWVARPAAVEYLDQTGYFAGQTVSAYIIIGDVLYGMISSARFPGADEPFAYDLIAQALIPVTGVGSGPG